MATDLERLVGMARVARAVFERVAERDGWQPDLGGLCYDASCFLRRMAARAGIATDMGQGDGHWFVLLGDMVVDITATQFGVEERVAVVPLGTACGRGPWWRLRGRHSDPPPMGSGDRVSAMADVFERDIAEGPVGR